MRVRIYIKCGTRSELYPNANIKPNFTEKEVTWTQSENWKRIFLICTQMGLENILGL